MLEQGVDLFCSAMEKRYPDLRPVLSDIEATYERATGIPRLDSEHVEISPGSAPNLSHPAQASLVGKALAEEPFRSPKEGDAHDVRQKQTIAGSE
jgi:hypothetical protein